MRGAGVLRPCALYARLQTLCWHDARAVRHAQLSNDPKQKTTLDVRWFDEISTISYSQSMKSTVSERGQVVIPKALRERLGIRAGEVLDFEARGGRLIVTKVVQTDPLDEVYGILKMNRTTDELIDMMRGEADFE